MAVSKGGTANEANILWLVNNDGGLVTVTLMRAQDVSGFAPHKTVGKFISISVRPDESQVVLCQRSVGGGQRLVYEAINRQGFLDSAIYFNYGAPTNTITNLEAYEGQSLYVIGDDEPLGTFVVTAGQIVLPDPITTGQYGYWIAPFAKDVGFFTEEETGKHAADLKRIYEVKLTLLDTSSVAVSANENVPYDVPLEKFDETDLDLTRMQRPFSGEVSLEGMPGFTRKGQVMVTQLYPGRLKVTSVKKGIAL